MISESLPVLTTFLSQPIDINDSSEFPLNDGFVLNLDFLCFTTFRGIILGFINYGYMFLSHRFSSEVRSPSDETCNGVTVIAAS